MDVFKSERGNEFSGKDRFDKMNRYWSNLSEDEKQRYNDMAAKEASAGGVGAVVKKKGEKALYNDFKREELKKKYPGMTKPELTKKIREEYKYENLSFEEQTEWRKRAHELRE
jgi:hypothetical protein